MFLCMAVRQCYGKRRRDQVELGLYRWTTPEDCQVLGGWIDPECTDKGVVQSEERIDEGVLRWFGHVERMPREFI